MTAIFGQTLKRMRLEAGFGLRAFAALIDMPPSNLSALEHGRRAFPSDPDRLRKIIEALGVVEDSSEWVEFFDSARKDGELPLDVKHLAARPLVPALLRTIDNRQLSDSAIANLIEEVNTRHGGQSEIVG